MTLKIINLTKKFDNHEVLKDLDFEFEEGKIYALLGKNGSGKTTLFNCLNNDLVCDSGKFLLDNKPLNVSDIGYVLSTPTVPEFLTAKEFLKFFIEINLANGENSKTIEEYLEMVSIDISDQDKLLKDFSHGMKNKIQMLVNFIANPKLLLLDEPLTSFDVVMAEEMKKILKKMKKGHIIIFSTHIMELALDLCDEIVLLKDKKLMKISKNKDKIISALKGDIDA